MPYSFPIVGVGASAGGLEAFTALLKALPPKLGMAYVLVPHLDPSRESAFTEILARTTTMPVLQIKDEMPVRRDHVYVIPPNCHLKISKGRLNITPREEPRSINTTVDIFLRSLAQDQGKNAIGVILSGTASDGTLGLTAVKGEGGITFAQDSRSAKYDSMPESAITSGCVDFVLPPEGIARELVRIREHPYVAGSPDGEDGETHPTDDASMAELFRTLRRATKVDFSEYKPLTISRRVQRRMALNKIHGLRDYVGLLHRDRGEVSSLYQDLLINVTSFFRNPEAFDSLKSMVYPAILEARRTPGTPIRIWVPGCSTGEETYSHAISLVEFLGEEKSEIPLQIFGTDLSETAIQRARAGLYKESIEGDVTPARLRRFFYKSDGCYQISKGIRDVCIFSTQNVFSDPPFSRMDLVSCRNVMIYLSQQLQRRVIPIFHYALKPTGFLMIGNTEGLLGAGSELFDMADKKQKIYRKRLVSTPLAVGFSVNVHDDEVQGFGRPTLATKPDESGKTPIELQREADRVLLTRYVPPTVLINDHMEILQTRGHTGDFLELPHGKPSLQLLKMARSGLLFELQKAIEEVRKNGAEIRKRNIYFESNGESRVVTLRVIPFQASGEEQKHFLIVFEAGSETERAPAADLASSTPMTDEERASKDEQIARIQQELAATREYLHAIIENQEVTNQELQSANEEIQSGNEELQSTNEELQTSKEELESANEELHTLNEEMQHRNDLLTQLNNDLNNLLNNVDLPMVMVGGDLTVRRFTPQAAAVLGLMNSDVGRPIPRLKLNIEVANLEQMILDVIRDAQAKQVGIQDNAGRSCRLRFTPYMTLDNRIDGVVLSVLDIEGYQSEPNGARSKSKESSAKNRRPKGMSKASRA